MASTLGTTDLESIFLALRLEKFASWKLNEMGIEVNPEVSPFVSGAGSSRVLRESASSPPRHGRRNRAAKFVVRPTR